jgi:hypothetical protein
MTASKIDGFFLPLQANLPSGSLRACWQSSWPSSRLQHCVGSRLVLGPLLQWIGDDQATNSRPAELWPAAGDCHRRNRWRCSAAGSPPAPRSRKLRTICFSRSTESGITSGEYPSQVSKHGQRPLQRAPVCSKSDGRFRHSRALSLARSERAAPSYPL